MRPVLPVFAGLQLADIHQDVLRNIVSLRHSEDLFDDLTDNPQDLVLAQQVEMSVKPPLYQSTLPLIDRPFEDAAWFNVISWPFRHWQQSRFSDGSYGVWYGCDSVEATVHESAYHWVNGLIRDAGFENETVVSERKVYFVACDAALLDMRRSPAKHPGLVHKSDYSFAQAVGARIHREGHPGVVLPSVRYPGGACFAVFNAAVLSNPRLCCQLSYRLQGGKLRVEKQTGRAWLTLDAGLLDAG